MEYQVFTTNLIIFYPISYYFYNFESSITRWRFSYEMRSKVKKGTIVIIKTTLLIIKIEPLTREKNFFFDNIVLLIFLYILSMR